MTALTIADTERFDAVLRLSGDEDASVGLMCGLCDRGGAPIAYCTWSGDRAYANTDVIIVATPTALIAVGLEHLSARHAA